MTTTIQNPPQADVKTQILERLDFIEEYKKIGFRFQSETPNADGWVPVHAYDRTDANASAAINITNGYYTDLGGSGQKLDFFDIMQMWGGYTSYTDVLKHYAETFGLELRTFPGKRKPPEASIHPLPWDGNADRWCGLKSTNRDAVERAGGFLAVYLKKYTCVAFPVFANPEITANGASGYVVAQTNGMGVPKLDKEGNVLGTTKYKVIAGTESGLIGTEALLKIQKAKADGTSGDLTIIKVEGISDATALLARIPDHDRDRYVVLTNCCGAGEKPKQSWASAFEGANVVVCHDADAPGQAGAKTWENYLAGLARSVKTVVLPFEITPDHGHDLKDYLQDHSWAEFLELVESTQESTATASSSQPEWTNDSPHRIAFEFLERKHRIEGHPGIYTLIYQNSTYYEWSGGVYRNRNTEYIKGEVTKFCLELFAEDYKAERAEWEQTGTSQREPKVRNTTSRLINDVLNILQALIFTTETRSLYWRDGEPAPGYETLERLIVRENGVLNVDRLRLRQPDYFMENTPLFFHTSLIPGNYDPKAWCDEWVQMAEDNLLDQRDGEEPDWSKICIFQEFMGLCLIPDTSMQKFMILEGEGRNGKSAMMMAMRVMFGHENVSSLAIEQFGERFTLIQLQDKLVNIVDDMSETDKVCEGKLKSIVSGQYINTDRKNKSGLNFAPFVRLIFACNIPPKFADKSNGIWRRLIMIRFNNVIPEEKINPDYSRVSFWEARREGLFMWCLNGLIRVLNEGKFTYCAETERAREEYKRDVNPVLSFFEETVEKATYGWIACSDLYKNYEKWCNESGYRPMNIRNFGKEVQRAFNVSRSRMGMNGQRRYIYQGIQYIGGTALEDL